MIKVTLKEYPNRCWEKAVVWENDILIRKINKYFEIKDDFIWEYDCEGGHDNPSQGRLIWKYSLKGKEFELERGFEKDSIYPEINKGE